MATAPWDYQVAMLVALSIDGTDTYGVNRQQIVCASLLAAHDARVGNEAIVPTIRSLIPNSNVSITVHDTEDRRGISIQEFNTAVFDGGAVAAVGPGRSSNCETLSLLGAIYTVPLLSYWCSSPALSDTHEYPFFARTYASDAVTVLALPQLIHEFGWRSVSMVYRGEEEYTVAYAAGLRESLPAAGIRLVEEATINEREQQTFAPALATIKQSGANIILAIITDVQKGLFFEVAQNASMMQPPFVWITPDALTIGSANLAHRPSVYSGLLNFYSSAVGTPGFARFTTSWRTRGPTRHTRARTPTTSLTLP